MSQAPELDMKLSSETVKLLRRDIGEKYIFFVVAIDESGHRSVLIPDENGKLLFSTGGTINLYQEKPLKPGVSGEGSSRPAEFVAREGCCQKDENLGHWCDLYDDGRERVIQQNDPRCQST